MPYVEKDKIFHEVKKRGSEALCSLQEMQVDDSVMDALAEVLVR